MSIIALIGISQERTHENCREIDFIGFPIEVGRKSPYYLLCFKASIAVMHLLGVVGVNSPLATSTVPAHTMQWYSFDESILS